MHRFYRTLGLSALALLSGCGSISRGLVYFPPSRLDEPCAGMPAGSYVQAEQLRYLKSEVAKPRGLAIYFHGNGSIACDRVNLAAALNASGLNVILAEYPGYSGDKAKIDEKTVLENALALVDHCVAQSPQLPLILYGESLGTGVATYIASTRTAKGLILQSPYSSLPDVGQKTYWFLPVRWILTEHYEASRWAGTVAAPVLAFVGEADGVVPAAISDKQLKNFKVTVTVERFQGAGHSDMIVREGQRYFAALARFIDKALDAH